MMIDPIPKDEIAASVQAQIVARSNAQERARNIVETAENLAIIVKSEIGRGMSERIVEIDEHLAETLYVVENRQRVSKTFTIRVLTGLRNKLAILSAAYKSGALPK